VEEVEKEQSHCSSDLMYPVGHDAATSDAGGNVTNSSNAGEKAEEGKEAVLA